jgi:Fic family protein
MSGTMKRKHLKGIMRELIVYLSERVEKQFTAHQISNFLAVGSSRASTYILRLVKKGAVKITKRGKRAAYEVIPHLIQEEL